jgi:uncharacterized SAM-binding protein YcdF (DUF218 family)
MTAGDERRRAPVPDGDAMPEIVMMSDTFGLVDLDNPEPFETSQLRTEDDPGVDLHAETHVLAESDGATDRMAVDVAPTPAATATVTPAATTVLPESTLVGEAEMRPGDPVEPVEPAPPVRRRRRIWPKVVLVLTIAVALVATYLGVSFWQVRAAGRTDQARPVDAIVVMGAAQYDGRPSPQLASRLDHVVTLWGQGLAPVVITTGGNRPGDRFTEAEASAEYLAERGVPRSAILQENSGSNTFESLDAVADLAANRGLEEVLIVTDPYHALRSRLTAEEVGLTAYVSPTPTSVVTGWAAQRRRVGEAAGVAIGRLIGFERLSGLTS